VGRLRGRKTSRIDLGQSRGGERNRRGPGKTADEEDPSFVHRYLLVVRGGGDSGEPKTDCALQPGGEKKSQNRRLNNLLYTWGAGIEIEKCQISHSLTRRLRNEYLKFEGWRGIQRGEKKASSHREIRELHPLYEREGKKISQKKEDDITLTRTGWKV